MSQALNPATRASGKNASTITAGMRLGIFMVSRSIAAAKATAPGKMVRTAASSIGPDPAKGSLSKRAQPLPTAHANPNPPNVAQTRFRPRRLPRSTHRQPRARLLKARLSRASARAIQGAQFRLFGAQPDGRLHFLHDFNAEILFAGARRS